MKTAIKGKTALLFCLLIVGLTLVGIGNALGAGTAFKGEADVLEARLVDDDIVIFKNSYVVGSVKIDTLDMEIVDTLDIPGGIPGQYEKVKLNIDMGQLSDGLRINMELSDDGTIHLGRLTEEEIERRQTEHDEQLSRWLELAESDSRVQEVIAGKEYTVLASAQSFGQEENLAFLMFDVEGKHYEVTIDLDSETVKSIEEMTIYTGEI